MFKYNRDDLFGKFEKEDFKKFRQYNQTVAKLLHEIEDEFVAVRGTKYLDRFENCGKTAAVTIHNNKLVSTKANYCNKSLCATCGRIAQQKEYEYILSAMNDFVFHNPKNYNVQFVTIAFKNEPVMGINESIVEKKTKLTRFFSRAKTYQVKGIKKTKHAFLGEIASKCKGAYWKYEQSYNKKTDMLHPHFHMIVVLEEGTSIVPEMWQNGMRELFGLDYDPHFYIEPVSITDEEDVVVNVAKIARYMNKGQDFDWANMPHDTAIQLLREMVLKQKRLQLAGGFGFFATLNRRKIKERKEIILDEIGEREEGMTDKEIDDVVCVNPVTKQEYSHEEKKIVQIPMWNMKTSALCAMTNSSDYLQSVMANEILRIKKKCAIFYEQKQQEFSQIHIATLNSILQREREKRAKRIYKEKCRQSRERLTYRLRYNDVLSCYMVATMVERDEFGFAVNVQRFNTYCDYQEFEQKKKNGLIETIKNGIYLQR